MRKYNYEKCIQKYCCEDISKIENYEKAKANNFEGWNCHHRLETHNSDGEKRLVDLLAEELIALDMYYNRPADELIFLTRSEHTIIHNKDKCRSTETKKKLSDSRKGKSSWSKGKHMTEEWKKQHPSFGASYGAKGKHWYTNGFINVLSFECPEGFQSGIHSRTKKKMSEAKKGKHWKLVDGKRVWY